MLLCVEMKNPDLLLSSYDFELPETLIAQRPIYPRDHSRLLFFDAPNDRVEHLHFYDLPSLMDAEDHIVLNDTKVFPCRLFVEKPTGGKGEIFFLDKPKVNSPCSVLIKASGKRKLGEEFLAEGNPIKVVEFNQSIGELKVVLGPSAIKSMEKMAKIPIPPYIRDGVSDEKDSVDYQTTYSNTQKAGSVAAPTAGLHFTEKVFRELESKKISKSFVTLSVGRGTFAPVKKEDLSHHEMHEETFSIDKEYWQPIKKSLYKDKNIVAVGTTSLRVLETVYGMEDFNPDRIISTDIFLYPGVDVKSIKGLVTNFHLPKSTLIMLVSALIGRKKTAELYELAVKEQYRFFSYGDAMFIKLR